MKFSLKGLLPLFIFLALGVALAIGLTKDPSKLPSELIDRPFPSFSLSLLADEAVILDNEYMKGRVTLVNVFGSWCVACVQEHPMLMKLAAKKEVVILGVNWRDTREDAAQWLKRYGDPYSEIVFDGDSALAIDLGVTGAPESFLIDKRGQIRYKYVGPITQEAWRNDLGPLARALRAEQ